MKGFAVKRTAIRYPIRIVRYAVDLEAKSWGIARPKDGGLVSEIDGHGKWVSFDKTS